MQFINDFIRNGMKAQTLLSKRIAATYYAAAPAYNYWNGCSSGGRQGYQRGFDGKKLLETARNLIAKHA